MVRTSVLTRRALLLGVLLVGPVQAQTNEHAVTADRPGFGDGAAVVVPGRVQVEAGYAFSRTDTTRRHSLGQVLLRVGVLPRVELRAALNSFVVFRQDLTCPPERDGCNGERPTQVEGFEDIMLGAKINLLPGRTVGKPTLTVIGGVGVPTGEEAFTVDRVRPEIRLALDLMLPQAVQFSGNAGYTFTLNDHRIDDFFSYVSLNAALPGREDLGVFAGIYSLFPRNFEPQHSMDAGFTYLPNAATQFDINVGLGLTHDAPDVVVGAGVARRF